MFTGSEGKIKQSRGLRTVPTACILFSLGSYGALAPIRGCFIEEVSFRDLNSALEKIQEF